MLDRAIETQSDFAEKSGQCPEKLLKRGLVSAGFGDR
jgi:hypothetical protein